MPSIQNRSRFFYTTYRDAIEPAQSSSPTPLGLCRSVAAEWQRVSHPSTERVCHRRALPPAGAMDAIAERPKHHVIGKVLRVQTGADSFTRPVSDSGMICWDSWRMKLHKISIRG